METVNETLKIIDFVAEAGNVIDKMSKEEGLVQKAMILSMLFDEVTTLLTLDIHGLKEEFEKGYSDSDKEIINDALKKKFDIENDAVEAVVEQSFEVVTNLIGIVTDIVKINGSIKKA